MRKFRKQTYRKPSKALSFPKTLYKYASRGARAYLALSKSPYGRLAVAASKRMRGMAKEAKQARAPRVRRRVTTGAFAGRSTGYYKGSFPRPGSANKGQGMEKMCQKRGHLTNVEVHGDIADPDCVYVTHNTYSADGYAATIGAALVRKLLVKGGFNPDSIDQEIPFADYNDADGFKLQYVLKDGSGSNFPTSYITVNNDTLSTVLQNGNFPIIAAIKNLLTVYYQGEYLERLTLYSSDRNGISTNWRLVTEINLEREVMTLYASSSLCIQNRTKAANGTAFDSDRVDNQPLRGFTYLCAGACPKTQSMNVTSFDVFPSSGIQLVRAAEVNASLKEPPTPNYFTNCYRRGPLLLDPGNIRSSAIYQKFVGFFPSIMGKLRVSGVQSLISGSNTQLAPGRCQIFALEERLNSGSANNITVSYECQKRYGCYFTTSKKSTMLASYGSAVQNNVPA